MEHEGYGGGESRPEGSVDAGRDRLSSMLSALNQLKSNISRIESKHPALGDELSSLCGQVIEHLNRPDEDEPESVASNDPEETAQPQGAPPLNAVAPVYHQETDLLPPPAGRAQGSASSEGRQGGISVDPVTPAAGPNPDGHHSNPIAVAFDAAGGHLASGLDKMGDGIIFAFEKLLRLETDKKRGAGQDSRT